MAALGFTEAGKILLHRTSSLQDSQWRDVLACEECGSLILGNSPRKADSSTSWLVLHRRWHQEMESFVRLSDPVFRENH